MLCPSATFTGGGFIVGVTEAVYNPDLGLAWAVLIPISISASFLIGKIFFRGHSFSSSGVYVGCIAKSSCIHNYEAWKDGWILLFFFFFFNDTTNKNNKTFVCSEGGVFLAKPMRDRKYVTMMDPFRDKYGKLISGVFSVLLMMTDLVWVPSTLMGLGKYECCEVHFYNTVLFFFFYNAKDKCPKMKQNQNRLWKFFKKVY